MADLSVTIGELYPVAVQVVPATDKYSDFTINKEDTQVIIQNSAGNPITTHGDVVIDQDNKTVLFAWDTSQYSVDQYAIYFWISITYQETDFLIRSEVITKSLRQATVF